MSKFKWILTMIVAVVIVIGLNFYLNGKLCWIREASAVNIVRRVVPGGPAQYLAQDGNYVVAVGIVSEENDDCALYLYDTKGTYDNFDDDTYTIIDQIDSDNGWFTHVTIDDNYITWIDSTGWSSCTALKLKGYYILTEDLFVISSNVTDFMYSRDGNLVVYECKGNNSDIKLFNLDTREESNICTANNFQKKPYIKNNIVVWEDLRNEAITGKDIYMYNLGTNTESVVSNAESDQARPVTNGSYIVYNHMNNGSEIPTEIRKYNISNSTTTVVATAGEGNLVFRSDINGQFLAWQETNNGITVTSNLYLYNLATSQNTLIEEAGNNAIGIAYLSSTQVVYYIGGGLKDVYGYNLISSQKYTIMTNGETYSKINLNREENKVIMSTKGAAGDPNEWDVAFAFIP